MKLIKYIVLLLFLKVFEKDIDNVEPEVDKFISNLLKPFIKEIV